MTRLVLASFLIPALSCCTFADFSSSDQRHAIQSGDKMALEKKPKEALKFYDKALNGSNDSLSLEAARRGARVAHIELKQYEKAIEFYRRIIVSSDSELERKEAQRSIAQIYFENLLYYDKAIIEYEKLLRLDFTPDEKYFFRLNVAKSHLQLGNLDQALAELEELSKVERPPNDYYDLQLFKANVKTAQKNQRDAADILSQLVEKFPERAQKEGLGNTLAVSYEEIGEYAKAIETLEKMKANYPHPEFLNTRIERLQAHMKNLPGANGFKK